MAQIRCGFLANQQISIRQFRQQFGDAASPDILFFDEPTSALDPILTREVLHAILTLRKQNRKFVIVTHEIAFARQVADVFVYMESGHVIESGPIAQLDQPQTSELQRFLKTVMSF